MKFRYSTEQSSAAVPGVLSGEGDSAGEANLARWSAGSGSGEWCAEPPPVPVPHGIVPEQYFGMLRKRIQCRRSARTRDVMSTPFT